MVKVYSLKGQAQGDVEAPKVFSTPYRPDLIQEAVVAAQAALRQPYGVSEDSGLKTSADYFGSRRRSYRQTINRGMTRLPRVKTGGGGLGRVMRIPQAVGGRRAHPPRGRDYSKKLNKKVHQLALNSAIAATADKAIVEARGHDFEVDLPYVVEDSISKINKTKDLEKALRDMGFSKELDSKRRKKLLIVVAEDAGVVKAAANLKGVDAVALNALDVDLLAPGTHPGRLTLWAKSTLKELEDASA